MAKLSSLARMSSRQVSLRIVDGPLKYCGLVGEPFDEETDAHGKSNAVCRRTCCSTKVGLAGPMLAIVQQRPRPASRGFDASKGKRTVEVISRRVDFRHGILRIPMMSITQSDLMPITHGRSDARPSQCELVIDISQEFC